VQSDYLQNAHKYAFLFKFPDSKYKFDSNVAVLKAVFTALGGGGPLCIYFHILTLFVGGIWLAWKHTSKSLLLLIPVIGLYIAAATHQYALTPRLILFIMPILL